VCLIAFAWRAHADYPLVVASNRDELFARPTASAAWSLDGRRLSGRDLRAGGTWMGVTRDGRFAALTNYRDPARIRANAPSRGALVDAVLDGNDVAGTIADIAARRADYNGFNLLAGRWDGSDALLQIVAHPSDGGVTSVTPGFHALSNAYLDTPWPKVVAITAQLRAAVEAADHGTDGLVERLCVLLANDRTYTDDVLPTTGIPLEFERALSAAFIRTPVYGTRSSTVFVVDRAGRATFVERRCEPSVIFDPAVDERRFAFATASSPISAARAS
jgi:uncharacterized protein with NRDE domain